MEKSMRKVSYQDREEWLKLRQNGVGASDTPCILGLSPFKNANDIYNDKKNPVKKETKTKSTKYGTEAEEYIRNLFALWYPMFHVNYKKEICVRIDKPYLFASLDGEVEVLTPTTLLLKNGAFNFNKASKGVLEIKTADVSKGEKAREWDDNNIPSYYLVQGLHQLMVTGYEFVIFVVLKEKKNMFKEAERWFDMYAFFKEDYKKEIEQIESRLDNFWLNNVEKNQEPTFKIKL